MKKGWPVTRLGDLTDLVTKGTTPTSIGHEFVEEGINFVKVESITTTGQFIEEKFAHITPACHAVLGRSQLQAGDILFSIAGALGRTGFVTDDILPANTNQALAIIRLKRDVGLSPKFVLKALETGVVLEQIEKFKGGVAQQNLSLAQVRDFQIALPPLAEQQRIVGLLDEAFEGLATAKANAEKNLQNARALFESHLQSVFTQRGPGWVEKTLGDVFTTATGTTPPKNNADFYGDFMPLVKPPELCDEPFDSAPDGLSEAGAAVARTLPAKSILVSCIGNLGKIGLNTVPVAFNQQINAILPDETQAIPEFMFFQSLAPVFKEQLESLASGTTVPIVNKSKFNSVRVVLPPLSIQKPVVAQLTDLREETQRLARLYEQKHAALEALKKSLLHQAFTGEL